MSVIPGGKKEGIRFIPAWVRAVTIVRAVIIYLLAYRLTRYRHERLGARLRRFCEDLGPLFIKLGQALGTRYDILSREDCDELHALLDRVPPVPIENIRALFVNDFGATPEMLYADFPSEPLASASIAQVYKARLLDGKEVAVKVRRPGIERTIAGDFKILNRVVGFAQFFSSVLRHINFKEILRQMEAWTVDETNFGLEIKNLDELRSFYSSRATAGDELAAKLVFPKIIPELCSENIITMEFLDGIPVSRSGETVVLSDYSVRDSLVAFLGSMIRAWVDNKDFVFHGDPHPANILIMSGGRVGVLDFGVRGLIDVQSGRTTLDLLFAVYANDLERSVAASITMCHADPRSAEKIKEDVREYLKYTRTSGLGFWFMGFVKIFVKHRLAMPYNLIMFGRTQTLIDGLFETALPGVKTLDILSAEFERGLRKYLLRKALKVNWAPVLLSAVEIIERTPERIAQLMDRYTSNPELIIKDVYSAVA